MTTLVSLWGDVKRRLEEAGVDTPVLDARLLLEAGAGVARLDIVSDPRREMSAEQVDGVEALVARRIAREPVSHILGKKAFWTLELNVTPSVLTPRPETEFLVELALELLPKDKPARVLDLGVGSGAILLTLLAERPHAYGIGLDVSSDALVVAEGNAQMLDLEARSEFHHGDWSTKLEEPFDLVLSNPPYIPTAEIDTLAPEVARYEPRLALDGGPDGLDAYRAITPRLKQLVRPGGAFAFEVGRGQADAVADLIRAAGLHPEEPRRDLGAIPRVVWGRLPNEQEA